MNIVFAGTPEFAIPSLNAISQKHRILAVYTQPDKPAGRGQKIQASAVKAWALANKLAVYQPSTLNDTSVLLDLKKLNPDLIIVIAYGLFLPEKILSIPRCGCINVHASLLPRWRGASPIQAALLQGDATTGVTIMQMEKRMDAGAILAQKSIAISIEDTAGTLQHKLSELAIEPLLTTISDLDDGKVIAQPQIEAFATYAPKILKTAGLIHWQEPATKIFNQIRAFNPWPGAFTHLANELFKIHDAQLSTTQSAEPPGTILALDKEGMVVNTGRAALQIKTIQFPGKKIVRIADCLNASNNKFLVHRCLQ